jgi:TolB-like protein/Tfp pilus assembly protein PilF
MSSLFEELKRRNVFRVAIFYLIVAWLVLQIADIIVPLLDLPEWTGRFILLMLGLGLPIALFFAWAYEMTPDGLKKEKDVDRSESITPQTGRKLDFVIIGLMAVALVYFAAKHEWDRNDRASPTAVAGHADPAVASREKDGRQSIAVLPFSNLSDSRDNAFFADGIHEDVLTQLSRIKALRVVSRTSVMKYSGQEQNIRAIAEELGVRNILEGSVRRAGNRVRITAQLIDAATDEHLWAERFDRDLDDIFAIQSEVAEAIARALQANLSPEEKQLLATAPTNNIDAYDLYLKARVMLRSADYSSRKYLDALPLLEQAVDADPQFALAWARLADVHGQLYWTGYDTSPERVALVDRAVIQARTYGDSIPEIHVALGDMNYRTRSDFGRALVEYQTALEQMPEDGDLWMKIGTTQRRLNLWEDSVASFRKAMQVEPENLMTINVLLETLSNKGDWEEALSLVEDSIQRYPDDNAVFLSRKADILMRWTGDLDQARELLLSTELTSDILQIIALLALRTYERDLDSLLAEFERPKINEWITGGNQFSSNMPTTLADAHALLGDLADALPYLEQAERLIQKDIDQANAGNLYAQPFLYSSLATVQAYLGEKKNALKSMRRAEQLLPLARDYLFGVFILAGSARTLAILGKQDESIDLLEKIIAIPAGPTIWVLRLHPQWDPLRENPRFQELVARDPLQQIKITKYP